MKKWISFGATLALVLALAACSGGSKAAAEYDPAATSAALLDSGAFSETLEPLDADLVPDLYGLEVAPDEAAVYTSTGATAEEVAVMKFADQSAADAALTALETRVADQKEACQDYLPAEMPKLEQAVVKESGKSVLLLVASDYDKGQSALDALEQ